MKKIIVIATAVFLVTGMAFAHEGDKKCAKGKEGCCKDKKECKMDMKKDTKATNPKATKVKS